MINRKYFQSLYPGIIVAAVLGLAAQSISDHYGAPVMLMALLLGMALNFLSHESRTKAGINFSAQKILRFGVALLGARISFDMIAGLGLETVVLTISALILTIGFGLLVGKLLKESGDFSLLTAGSVAICGASAAMAIGAVLPSSKERDEQLLFTVAGVTLLSTLAMVLYPVIATKFGFTSEQIGVFLGATIHDVAQVVGAGYSVSDESGDIATIVKLLRVVMLAPVIVVTSLLVRRRVKKTETLSQPPIMPAFVLGFIILVILNSCGLLPNTLREILMTASRAALVIAIAAVGMKINLGELRKIGGNAFILIVSETVFVAGIVTLLLLVL